MQRLARLDAIGAERPVTPPPEWDRTWGSGYLVLPELTHLLRLFSLVSAVALLVVVVFRPLAGAVWTLEALALVVLAQGLGRHRAIPGTRLVVRELPAAVAVDRIWRWRRLVDAGVVVYLIGATAASVLPGTIPPFGCVMPLLLLAPRRAWLARAERKLGGRFVRPRRAPRRALSGTSRTYFQMDAGAGGSAMRR